MRGSSSPVHSSGRPSGAGRMVRNLRIEKVSPFLPTRVWRYSSGPRLPNRLPTSTTGVTRASTRVPASAQGHVDDPLHPAVAAAGGPRRCRTSSTPAPARPRAACPATPRRRATGCGPACPAACRAAAWATTRRLVLGRPVEHEDGGALGLDQLGQRPDRRSRSTSAAVGSNVATTAAAVSAPRSSSTLSSWPTAAACSATTTHPVAALVGGAPVEGQVDREQVPGHQEQGAAEHDEAGQQGVADHELDDRDAQRPPRARRPPRRSPQCGGVRGTSGRPRP